MDTGVKLVLIGADHRRADLSYDAFASTESIQCTEIFEYVQRLSDPEHAMMPFQHFKFLHAVRLLDHGMAGAALEYFEQIASCLVKRPSEVTASESADPASFAGQLLVLCDRLKYLDPSYATRDGEVSEMTDPEWLEGFKSVAHTIGYYDYGYQYENYDDQANYDPQQAAAAAAEGSSNGHVHDRDHLPAEIPDQNGQIQHPAESAPPPPTTMNAIPEETHGAISTAEGESPSSAAASPPPPPMFQPGNMSTSSSMPPPLAMPPVPPLPRQNSVDSTSSSQHQSPKRATPSETRDGGYFAGIQRRDSLSQQPQPPPSRPPMMNPSSQTAPPAKPATTNAAAAGSSASQDRKKKNEPKKESGPGLFGRIIGTFIKPGNQAHLPKDTDNSIVWDEENKRWIDKNADPDDDANGASAAPPSDMELSRNNSSADMAALAQQPAALPPPGPGVGNTLAPPAAAGSNKFAGGLGKRRGASGRVDVFKQSQSSPSLVASAAAAAPAMIPPPGPMMTPMSMPPPQQETDHDSSRGNGPISMSAAAAPTAADGASDAASAAPQFFNPNQFAGAAPVGATKRNKYH